MTNLFAVPAHARPAWDQLHAQILATGPTPCAGAHRDDWTGTPRQQADAVARCFDCAAFTECDRYADTADERIGVWAGLTPQDRAALRRKDTPA